MTARAPQPLRERILDAAVGLLKNEGVKRLAQPQVARAAGIPQGHLTYYFPRKSDLLLAVARRSIEVIAQELADFFAGEGWPGAAASLRAKAMALIGFQVKNRERTRMLLGLLVEADEDPALRATMIENAGRVRGLLAKGLGVEEDDPDVEIVQATLWGLALMHMLYSGQRPDAATDALLARLPTWLEVMPTAPPQTGRQRRTR